MFLPTELETLHTRSPNRDSQRSEKPITVRRSSGSLQKKHAIPKSRPEKAHPPHQNGPSKPQSQGLQFINLLGTEKHDNQGRNTVRSHARRHAWKNQKEQQEKTKPHRVLVIKDGSQSPSDASLPRQQFEDESHLELVPGSRSYHEQYSKLEEFSRQYPQHAYDAVSRNPDFPFDIPNSSGLNFAIIPAPSIPHINVTNGHSDPFDAFPIPLTPRLHHLIHNSHTKSRTLLHDDPRASFSAHMGNSEALAFAILAWTSAISSHGNETGSLESEHYIGKSITAINSELSKVDQTGLADSTIAAVACLTNMENLNGEKSKAKMHMNGLRQMVAMRGGMNSLGMNGVLRRLILWADVFSATRWQSTPQFDLLETPDLMDLAPLCSFRNPTTPKPHFTVLNDALIRAAESSGNENLFSLMSEVYELAHFLDNAPPKDPGLLDRASFADRIYIIEHKILCAIAHTERTPEPTSIILPLLHSLLLYIYTNIRLTPVDGPIRFTLISRLRRQIELSDLPTLNAVFPHELRWTLFLGGGAASKGTEERNFFVQKLLSCGCRREWGTWKIIVLLLKGFESAFLIRCEDFWSDFMAANTEHRVHGPDCITDDIFADYILD